jgi:CrcB protein
MKNPWMIALLVGCGGFAGTLSRYGLSLLSRTASIEWPVGTLAANALGCFLIGGIVGLAARDEILPPEMRLALATGFCGGFTTMSSMIYEAADMLRTGEYLHATLYTAGTVLLSLAAFGVGIFSVRILTQVGNRLLG